MVTFPAAVEKTSAKKLSISCRVWWVRCSHVVTPGNLPSLDRCCRRQSSLRQARRPSRTTPSHPLDAAAPGDVSRSARSSDRSQSSSPRYSRSWRLRETSARDLSTIWSWCRCTLDRGKVRALSKIVPADAVSLLRIGDSERSSPDHGLDEIDRVAVRHQELPSSSEREVVRF